jgi:uncharacterized protein (TIGR02145 family)
MINKIIGNYRIIRIIGEGGMATVYEAEHLTIKTRVAIKILNSNFSRNNEIRKRFRNEAEIMATLIHRNITKIIDFYEDTDNLSIVMELLEGDDLNNLVLKNGPLKEIEIYDIFSQVLSALQFAHEQGILHRDIKPSNIFVLQDRTVKILDFGIAKVFGDNSELTQTGHQVGTPLYMSPEQVRSDKTIDHRTDIYSLGVTMFFAYTGSKPYDVYKESQFDIYNKIVTQPIVQSNVDDSINKIIKKATNKNIENRYSNCTEWMTVLNSKHNLFIRKSELTHIETAVDEKNKKDNLRKTNNGKKEIKKINDNIASHNFKKSKLYIFLSLAILIILLIYFKGTNSRYVDGIELDKSVELISDDIYPSVKIGDQIWMTSNLDHVRFQNGDIIPQAVSDDEWKQAGDNKQPAWCYYNYDSSNGEKFGKLYNWYAVNDSRGLAPDGWIIPKNSDWTILFNTIGGEELAGFKLKSNTGWINDDNGSNSTLFNGKPGGCRYDDGSFINISTEELLEVMPEYSDALFEMAKYDSSLQQSYAKTVRKLNEKDSLYKLDDSIIDNKTRSNLRSEIKQILDELKMMEENYENKMEINQKQLMTNVAQKATEMKETIINNGGWKSYFWTSEELIGNFSKQNNAYYTYLSVGKKSALISDAPKSMGFYVRCLKK